MRSILLSLVFLALSSLAASAVEKQAYSHDDLHYGGHEYFEWPGSERALPINEPAMPYQEIVQHALAMEAVQTAIADFLARGYVRRPEFDTAQSLPLAAAATIAFEKPGEPAELFQPLILVTSQKIGDYAATQVSGGIVRSENGEAASMVFTESVEDPSIVIRGEVVGEDARDTFEPENLGVHLAYSTCYDRVGTWGWNGKIWNYMSCYYTDRDLSAWGQWGNAVLAGVETAMWSGLRNGMPTNAQQVRGLAFGAVIGGYAANRGYWVANPDGGC
jgi:hypothetical protein